MCLMDFFIADCGLQLDELCRAQPLIESLDLKGCIALTQNIIKSLRRLSQLSMLDVTGCIALNTSEFLRECRGLFIMCSFRRANSASQHCLHWEFWNVKSFHVSPTRHTYVIIFILSYFSYFVCLGRMRGFVTPLKFNTDSHSHVNRVKWRLLSTHDHCHGVSAARRYVEL